MYILMLIIFMHTDEQDGCPSCISLTACTTSTDVSLNITMWFNDSLISTPCELYRNGDVVPNIEPTSCIALNRVEHDFNMDTFTIVCPTCNDTYNIHYNIPRIMLTNVSDCSISGM